MSKKKLQNRLDNLLVELEQDATFLPTSGVQSVPGWSWEADHNGCYVSCTPEVENILGIRADDLIGKPLASFYVKPESHHAIQEALQNGKYPAEVNACFQCIDGPEIPVKLVIFGIASETEGFDGYRGFVQLSQPGRITPFDTAQADVEEPEIPTPSTDKEHRPPTPPKPSRKEPTRPQTRRVRQPKQEKIEIIDKPLPELPTASSGAVAIARSGDSEEPASIIVPVKMQEDSHGLLEIIDDDPNRYWSEDDRRLVEQISDQLTLALENAYLFQAEQRRATELNTLVELSRLVSQNLDLEEVFTTAHRIIGRLMQTESFLINLLDERTNDFLAAYVFDKGERMPEVHFPLTTGFSGYVFRTGEPYLARDLDVEPTPFARQALPNSKGSVRSVMTVPLKSADKVSGTISVQSTAPYAFSDYDLKLLGTFADHIAIAINNARLFEQTQNALTNSENLYSITSIASRSLNLDEILGELLEKVMASTGFEVALITLYNPATGKLELKVHKNLPEELYHRFTTAGFEGTLCQLVYDRAEIVSIANLQGPTPIDAEGIVKLGLLSYAGTPLISKNQALGTLCAFSYSAQADLTDEVALMEVAGQQIGIAVENANLFQLEQKRRQVADTLSDIARVVGSTLDLHEIIERMLDFLPNLIDFRTASVQLIHNRKRQLIGGRGFDLSQPEGGEHLWRPIDDDPLITEVVASKVPLVLSDTRADPRWEVHPETDRICSWIAAPLMAGDEVVGLLTLDHDRTGTYTNETAELSAAVAAQVAIAIQNARLFQQTQETLGETETLYETSTELNVARNYMDILTALRNHTILGDRANRISIGFFDRPVTTDSKPEMVDVIARWEADPGGETTDRYPVSAFAAFDRLKADTPFIVEDFATNTEIDEVSRQLYLQQLKTRSTIFFPLVVTGQWMGFVNAQYPHPRNFSDTDVRKAWALITQASVAIQNLRNIDIAEERAKEAQRRSEELALINRVVSAVVSSPDLRQVLEIMATELANVFEIGHVGISLIDDDRKHLNIVSDKYLKSGPSEVGTIVALRDIPACQEAISKRSLMVIPDVQTNPIVISNLIHLHWQEVHSIVLLPIISGGNVTGIVNMDVMEKGRQITAQELTLAETLVGQISTAIQNANLFDQIQNALAETETLYRASAELNAIESYDDILTILRKTTILGHPEAGNSSINLFDRPWVGDEMPDNTLPIARWARVAYLDAPATRLPLKSWANVKQLLRPDQAVAIEDTNNDPRVDRTTQTLFIDRLGSKSLLYAPLVVGGRWIGHISSSYMEPIRFPTNEIKRLMALASQAAVSIQNIRLLEESRRRAAQLETAAEIARDTSGTLALDTLLRRAVNLIRDRYGFYHASIFLVDESGLNAIVRESTGEAGEEMKRRAHKLPVGSRSLIGYVTETGKPLVLNDVTQDPIHRPNPLLPDTHSELGLPLKIGNRVIGALDVQSVEVNAFSQDDVNVVQTLADQIAVAVDNAHSYELAQQAIEETRQRVQELSALFGVSQSLAGAAMETEEIANIVSKRFIELLNFPQCSITLIDPETNDQHVILELARDRDPRRPSELKTTGRTGVKFSLQDSPTTSKVIDTLLPIVVQASDTTAPGIELDYMKSRGVATMAIIPLAVKGQAIGSIRLEAWDVARSLTPDQLNLSMIMANAAAVALENARLYTEQREATDKLRDLDRMKSQFLANMSHELRTPLNSIIGFSRVILKGIDGPVTDLQQQDLSAIFNAGQHLLDLINNILDISKIEAGKMELAFDDSVNLSDLLNSVMSTAAGLVKDKPIKLERFVEEDMPPVRADVTRIRQVVLNLISNAVKFTDAGTIAVRVETQINEDGRSEAIVKVVDSGIGIAEVDHKKLFQPFSQVDDSPTRKTGGTGLGLSICRLLIEMHGGKIGVISQVGKGSTFWFTLPLPNQAIKRQEGKKLILAVDDERPILNLYERYLSAHGYQVIPLTDPLKVVERAKEVRPFAITLDVMMPNKNGWQVLESLKSDLETRNIPVVVCSILEDTEKGFSLGAADYLMKPILEEDLVTALKRLNSDGSIREILIIDDDATDLRLLEKLLGNQSNFHLTFANGGTQGLVAIQSNKPHLVILDLFMPGLDGFTLIETMRADVNLRNIPVIIFTAGDLTEEQQQHLSKFTERMLQKGVFKEDDLLKSIESALKRFEENPEPTE